MTWSHAHMIYTRTPSRDPIGGGHSVHGENYFCCLPLRLKNQEQPYYCLVHGANGIAEALNYTI